MNPSALIQFKGKTAEEVFQKVQQALGPAAVVVQLKRVTAPGVGRLWGAMEIEAWARPGDAPVSPTPRPRTARGGVGVREVLHSWGLAAPTVDIALRQVPEATPSGNADEGCIRAAAGLLAAWDRLAGPLPKKPRRIALLGPPGSGKSTCLAKWLTVETLKHHRLCRVWRLDGAVVNGAEALSLHAELMGVPVETSWNPSVVPMETEFLDLPGWNGADRELGDRMANLLDRFEPDFVGIVGNLAYEQGILASQMRSFDRFRPNGLLLTHLDEIETPSRVWDLVLQLQRPLAATSSGPWIPGGFERHGGEVWVERLLAAV